jgi:hypothetical protein
MDAARKFRDVEIMARHQPNPKKTEDQKSRTVSFRLNPEDPDESEALGILQHWEEQGMDRRLILTKALLALEGYDLSPDVESGVGSEIRSAVNRLTQILDMFRDVDLSQLTFNGGSDVEQQGRKVDQRFLKNMAALVQPGLHDEE